MTNGPAYAVACMSVKGCMRVLAACNPMQAARTFGWNWSVIQGSPELYISRSAAMRSACGLVWALGLALAVACAAAQPPAELAADQAPAPAPGFDRGQKFLLPRRPEGWTLAGNAVAGKGLPGAQYAAAPAPVRAEQAPAPLAQFGPKYQLPGRPTDGDFAASLSTLGKTLADYQLHSLPTSKVETQPLNARVEEAASPSSSPGFPRDARYILPPRPTEEWRPATDFTREEQVAPTGFVKTAGTNFVLDGKVVQFAGTNGYFVILRCGTHLAPQISKYIFTDHLCCQLSYTIQAEWLHFALRRSYLTDDQVKLYFKVCTHPALRPLHVAEGAPDTSSCRYKLFESACSLPAAA